MISPLSSAYDNIRLLRRKVEIAQKELEGLTSGPRRDEAMIRLSQLEDDLVRAVRDFAEMGFEEQVAGLLSQGEARQRSAAGGMH